MNTDSRPLSRASIVGWTLWTAIVIDVAAAAILSHEKVIGVLDLGALVVTAIFSGMGIARRISLRHRVLRMLSGFAIAAVWPVVAWLVTRNLKPLSVVGFAGGAFAAIWLMSAGFAFADRRGWLVKSPWRGRVFFGAMLVMFASDLAKWPTGVWREVLFAAYLATFALTFFWPARRRPPQHNQPAAV